MYTNTESWSKENFDRQSNQTILTKYERQKLSNRYAFWENIYQLGENLKFALISTQGKKSNTMMYVKFFVQRWEQNISAGETDFFCEVSE